MITNTEYKFIKEQIAEIKEKLGEYSTKWNNFLENQIKVLKSFDESRTMIHFYDDKDIGYLTYEHNFNRKIFDIRVKYEKKEWRFNSPESLTEAEYLDKIYNNKVFPFVKKEVEKICARQLENAKEKLHKMN